MTDLIRAEGLTKTYGSKTVLDRVDLRVPAGSIVGFVGANGAGKTTTIRALLGLMPLDAGRVVLFGEPFDISADAATCQRIKGRVGAVLDTCPFVPDLSVKTVGSLMKAAYPTWRADLFEEHLRRFELDPRKKIKEFSRGMGMKLQLACALAHEPDVLLLDEATAGLDPLARDEVLDILRAFVSDENHAVLLSSHITTDLEKIADVIVGIDQGRIVFSLEKDVITDEMGIARCRSAELEGLVASGLYDQKSLRVLRRPYGIDVLVPDRFALARRFPEIPCDKATIEDYLQFVLTGEQA